MFDYYSRYDNHLKEELSEGRVEWNISAFKPTMHFVENYLYNIATSQGIGFADADQNKLTYEVSIYNRMTQIVYCYVFISKVSFFVNPRSQSKDVKAIG